ncbi:hypothetical protein [Novosphingobium album (ex Hu et al. 2023)]|uniref:DUF541 domain-containing protein n=1 Tax=Novosphingobium album (ex Hu et al. 2023) TaxID=2930093 RepID=A0ABT0B5E0_9SPHN|nr:hypothetical protein [Novosphingobium album (ex Hu et al. 2023)]MCJ2180291.1 hypothetical protein [Novosphingobium album (ex Hu et al. 2023)]
MRRFAWIAFALAIPTSAIAGTYGFEIGLGSAQNMDGATVPEVVLTVDAGRTRLDRAQVQGAVRSQLSHLGVTPHIVEVQTVATAAIQFAAGQDAGSQTMCFERWCASVALSHGGH